MILWEHMGTIRKYVSSLRRELALTKGKYKFQFITSQEPYKVESHFRGLKILCFFCCYFECRFPCMTTFSRLQNIGNEQKDLLALFFIIKPILYHFTYSVYLFSYAQNFKKRSKKLDDFLTEFIFL